MVVYSPYGPPINGTTTTSAGTFSVQNLDDGSYVVRTFNEIGFVDEIWDDIPCLGDCQLDAGQMITISNASAVTGIDFELGRGGAISGEVLEQATGAPIIHATIDVFDANGVLVRQLSWRDNPLPNGLFNVGGLPAGNYFATASTESHYRELYQELDCLDCEITTGTSIAVLADETTGSIDFSLSRGGRVEGKVTEEVSGMFLQFVDVEVEGPAFDLASTDFQGHYSTSADLEPGTYTALALDPSQRFQPEFWDDVSCQTTCDPAGATPIEVTIDSTISGIDFSLTPGSSISGEVSADGEPISDGHVLLFDSSGLYLREAAIGYDGRYRFDIAAPGSYYLVTKTDWLDESYPDVLCEGPTCNPKSGQPVALASSQVLTGLDFNLVSGGSISGRVVDAVTGRGISVASITIVNETGLQVGAADQTDLSGYFTSLSKELAGVHFAVAMASDYESQIFDGVGCDTHHCDPLTGTAIVVNPGAMNMGIDFSLRPLSTIGGHIVSAPSLFPVRVEVFDESGEPYESTYSTVANNWKISLPGGLYFAIASRPGSEDVVPELYDGIQCIGCNPTLGQPIEVMPGQILDGIDFSPRPAVFFDGFESGDFLGWGNWVQEGFSFQVFRSGAGPLARD